MHNEVVSREKWLQTRIALLADEKALTRQSDELARRRRELPWARIDKRYTFETEEGEASLADLFEGRSQLLVYHFMFGPDYKAGCPSCSAIADGFNGIYTHLQHHDVAFFAVSQAPLERLLGYRGRMGWSFPWASASGGDFNFDFNVSITEEQQRNGGTEYNYRSVPPLKQPEGGTGGLKSRATPEGPGTFAAQSGTDMATYVRERPGVSAFAREGDEVFHTYSAYARGLDSLWGMYQWLDRAPKGRNETGGIWWRRHDEYGNGG